jgi:hypothetical protein
MGGRPAFLKKCFNRNNFKKCMRLFSKDIDFAREQKAPLHKKNNHFATVQAAKRAKPGLSNLNPC